jgi:hypothetical protein
MHRNGTLAHQNKKNETSVFVSMPWLSGIVLRKVKKDGHIAPIMTRVAFAPFMFWMAYQKMARMAREMMAM